MKVLFTFLPYNPIFGHEEGLFVDWQVSEDKLLKLKLGSSFELERASGSEDVFVVGGCNNFSCEIARGS